MITQEEQQKIIDRFGNGPNDTGTPEVQIAIFTKRIEHLTEHLEDHPNDNSTRQGLLDLVGKRRRLLNYLQENEIERYRTIRDELELRK
ncbi:small subunit ribosomal protein S15 [Salinibacter ruber]|jgi:small subunit ribosomal protein S15|uniref:Small ribosomal subunit protein uS15 n=3 Tax=Salinibacter ruber TaxID=146919 RepID=RS15_SALRD|nr:MULTISPECIES: 30S ribosomal protein S15 [Salinibacter]Q2S1P0.1 RecName: Full=Small ribosomal subunit protein uS15; AltName: Full=30S ribosomal protein S15 [Salinibacter ruber DSM 13855]ABC45196.1 ribosomal protein S15 [Salinibacter ruber DSM 13855]MBB4059933.1 small subunit ribosomal protein S15 [Salinibacter ruber]MBB4069829.1 small subunit ribosomal protein S15 [Salinibacter ruber]MBB4089179.1 small subunit ribosomal protein S15 [Salinibacter ruber]MCS3611989.1 small subunit ribosomal pr